MVCVELHYCAGQKTSNPGHGHMLRDEERGAHAELALVRALSKSVATG